MNKELLIIFKKILSKLSFSNLENHDEEYMTCIQDLIYHEEVKSLEKFVQHKNTDRLQHSLSVSYKSFHICKKLGLDHVSAARGGLLHDFFHYDWREKEKSYEGMHGFAHPKIALENASKHFELNHRERDIIVKHMWPLTITIPKYKEAWVIIAVDKYCAVTEFFNVSSEENTGKFISRVEESKTINLSS